LLPSSSVFPLSRQTPKQSKAKQSKTLTCLHPKTFFNPQGITYQLTQGVVKNIIPAIASTNAIVAAACALEALKLITMCSKGMDNYMM
jgi:hypothetical protein